MDKKNKNFEIGSENIFADLGISNPEEYLAKAKIALQINTLIKAKNLSQKAAAQLLEVDQPKISALHKGKLAGFSLERLFRFLNILGQDITIKITPKIKSKKRPDITVNLAKIKQNSTTKSYTRTTILAKKK